jgi:hypothetical protein
LVLYLAAAAVLVELLVVLWLQLQLARAVPRDDVDALTLHCCIDSGAELVAAAVSQCHDSVHKNPWPL